jgi:hypothetical protein
MARHPCIFVVVVALAIGLCLASPAARAASDTPIWLEIHSSHFTVITDAPEKKGREVALRFEQMRSVFANLLSKDRLNQSVPLTILAFKDDKTYYRLAPLRQGQPIEVPGFFLPGDDQDFIGLNLVEDQPWRAVAHDFAHMLLNYNYPPAQAWFDEGLAEYFSSIRMDDKQIEIGADPELQPNVNQNAGGAPDANAGKSLTEILNSETWMPLPELFSARHDSSGRNEDSRHSLYYAESWIVIHYLVRQNKMSETGTYLGLVLAQHVPVEEAIQKAYGMPSAQLEQAVKDYFHSQAPQMTASTPTQAPAAPGATSPAQAYHFPTPVGPDDSAIISKPMLEADARAIYAGVQLRIPDRRDAGLRVLQELATAPTLADKKAEAKAERTEKKDDYDGSGEQLPTNAVGNPIAHRFLAWDHLQHGAFDEALSELGQAAALNQRDMWIRYYLSSLKYRVSQARHSDIPGLANMLLDLRAVLEWYPQFADAYDLLAVGRNEGGTTDAAMQAERAAMTLSPRDERYAYHLALIYISDKKWPAAQAQLEQLKSASDPQIAKLASERLDQINSQRKYGMTGVGAAANQAKLSPQKSPFDVLEQDAANRAAAEKTSDARDLRPTKFLNGRLIAVDCSEAPAAILTISAQGIVLKLRAADYKSLLLIGADGFSCDWRNRQVSANYKAGGTADGDLVSLEMR